MATNANAAALDESPVPEPIQKQSKQTIDPYNVCYSRHLILASYIY
jgi:tryptophanyl-tRNA synthetase